MKTYGLLGKCMFLKVYAKAVEPFLLILANLSFARQEH
jgi:hypothetical protein